MEGERRVRSDGELQDIASFDDPDLRDRLSGLSLKDQVEFFRRSNWLDRVKIVKNSDLADEVVASMPDEEILLTFKGAGEDEGLALIGHCGGEQLRFVLDIDLWNEHAVDDERVVKWLGYLVFSGERTIVEFVRACDVELTVVFLSKLIRLIPFDEAVEMGEELTSIMPDEAFIVQSLIPEETPAIRLLLTTIMVEDRDLYNELRYSVYRGIAAETEDEAYRWRNSRLEEKGILEYGEAAGIYECLSESEVRELVARKARPYYSTAQHLQVPAFYPLTLSGSRALYYELLEAHADEVIKSRIAGDVSYLTNRLLVADGRTIGDVDATRAALGRLFSLASVGLLHMAEKTGRPPGEVLVALSVSDLFRLGLSLVMGLKSEADGLAGRCTAAQECREYPLFENFHIGVLKGLRMKVPQHYEPGATATEDYRDFMTTEEVATAGKVLQQVSVLIEACYGKLGIMPATGGAADFGNILMTGFAHFVLEKEFDVAPLNRQELGKFLDAAFVVSEEGDRSLDPAVSERFIAWLKRRTGFRGHKWGILEAYHMERLELLEEDLSGASSARDVDPIVVESILLEK